MTDHSRIAIIGGGVGGLGAAWRLNQKYDITLYEAGRELGGHAHTVTINTFDGLLTVDMGVQAIFLPDYGNLAALFRRYNVDLVSKPLSFGTSINSDAYWGNLPQNIQPAFWNRVKDDAERFTSLIKEVLTTRPLVELGQLPLKDFLQLEDFSEEFIYSAAYPMFTIPLLAYDIVPNMSTAFIAALFVDYLEQFTKLSTWTYIKHSTRSYIDKVTHEFKDKIRVNTQVKCVTRLLDGVIVEDQNGHREHYDQVVFATPGPVTLSLLGDASEEETLILEGLKTRAVKVTLHRDARVLSPHFAESPANQFTTQDGNPQHGANHYDIRQWLDLDNLAEPLIQSTNYDVPEEYVYETRYWDVDTVTPQGMYSRLLLQTIQGQNRTWYCGRSVTLPSHEESFISGLVIAEYLGVEYPFPDDPQAVKQYQFVKNFVMGEQGKYEAYTPFKE
jgi:predicted NAD/FAD-binding protein